MVHAHNARVALHIRVPIQRAEHELTDLELMDVYALKPGESLFVPYGYVVLPVHVPVDLEKLPNGQKRRGRFVAQWGLRKPVGSNGTAAVVANDLKNSYSKLIASHKDKKPWSEIGATLMKYLDDVAENSSA